MTSPNPHKKKDPPEKFSDHTLRQERLRYWLARNRAATSPPPHEIDTQSYSVCQRSGVPAFRSQRKMAAGSRTLGSEPKTQGGEGLRLTVRTLPRITAISWYFGEQGPLQWWIPVRRQANCP